MKKIRIIPVMLTICIGLILSAGNVVLFIDSNQKLDELTKANCSNPVMVLFDWQSSMIQQEIKNVKNQLKYYATSGDVIELLKNPGDKTLTKKAQEYTMRFNENLEGWEGLYIEDWNTKVLCHTVPSIIGAVIRKDDTLEQFRQVMLGSPDNTYFSGCVESPATGKFVMSFCLEVKDDKDQPIGIVGGASYLESLRSRFSKMDMSSANVDEYALINADNCLYAYHSDNSFIGQEVTDSELLRIVDKVAEGSVDDTYTHNGKIIVYRKLPDTNMILTMKSDESKFNNTDRNLNARATIYFIASEVLIIIAAVVIIMTAGRRRITESHAPGIT